MPVKQLNPYLFFDGTAAQAIALYERALGARTEGLMRYKDVPDTNAAAEHADLVMHAQLHVGQGTFMVSDVGPGMTYRPEGNVEVVLDFDDPADMARRFEAMAAGGKVTMALHDTFWGATFGTLTDAYGVPWMFNCDKKKA